MLSHAALPVRQPVLSRLSTVIKQSWAHNRPLTFVGLSMVVVLLATLVGIAVDPRVITGAPAWLKPAKFAISVAIYSLTLVWLLSFVRGRPRLVSLAANVTAFAFVVEMAIIVGQAARGLTSHFNTATPLDTLLFTAMAGMIVVLWTMNILTAGLLLFQRLPDPVMAWGLRLGLILSVVGMGVAFLMTSPTPAQLAAAEQGQGMTVAGAHSVGVADGGPGLPIVGWSTVGGDLRVPHFIGLHGMQVLPLAGWALTRRRAAWLTARSRVVLVWTAGLTYGGVIGLLTWQALRGQPLIAPDGLTLTAFAGLLVAAGVVAGTAVLRGRTGQE